MKNSSFFRVLGLLTLAAASTSVLANEELSKQLVRAAGAGDLTEVTRLIEDGANVNYLKKPGTHTPLTAAVQEGQYEVVAELLSRGADVDGFGLSHFTPLMIAANKLDFELVQILVSHRANVNKKSSGSYGGTALMMAISSAFGDPVLNFPPELRQLKYEQKVEIVRLLLEVGADPNIACDEGGTALLNAVWVNDPILVDLLQRKGAKTTARTAEGDTISTIAERASKLCQTEEDKLKSEKVRGLLNAAEDDVQFEAVRNGILERSCKVLSLREYCLKTLGRNIQEEVIIARPFLDSQWGDFTHETASRAGASPVTYSQASGQRVTYSFAVRATYPVPNLVYGYDPADYGDNPHLIAKFLPFRSGKDFLSEATLKRAQDLGFVNELPLIGNWDAKARLQVVKTVGVNKKHVLFSVFKLIERRESAALRGFLDQLRFIQISGPFPRESEFLGNTLMGILQKTSDYKLYFARDNEGGLHWYVRSPLDGNPEDFLQPKRKRALSAQAVLNVLSKMQSLESRNVIHGDIHALNVTDSGMLIDLESAVRVEHLPNFLSIHGSLPYMPKWYQDLRLDLHRNHFEVQSDADGESFATIRLAQRYNLFQGALLIAYYYGLFEPVAEDGALAAFDLDSVIGKIKTSEQIPTRLKAILLDVLPTALDVKTILSQRHLHLWRLADDFRRATQEL